MNMQSESIAALAAALAKAQGEMHGAAKAKVNPHFKSKYADLEAVWEACREPLSKNGLSVTQTYGYCEAGQVLYTQLMHASGEWIRSEYLIRPVQDTPQGRGSAETYAKRYNLAAIVGVAPKDEDDDGNAASEGTPRQHPPSTPPRPNGGNGLPGRVSGRVTTPVPPEWKARAAVWIKRFDACETEAELEAAITELNQPASVDDIDEKTGEVRDKVSPLDWFKIRRYAKTDILNAQAMAGKRIADAKIPPPKSADPDLDDSIPF